MAGAGEDLLQPEKKRGALLPPIYKLPEKDLWNNPLPLNYAASKEALLSVSAPLHQDKQAALQVAI